MKSGLKIGLVLRLMVVLMVLIPVLFCLMVSLVLMWRFLIFLLDVRVLDFLCVVVDENR